MEEPSRALPAANPAPAAPPAAQMPVPVSPSPATSQDNTAPGAARTDVNGPSQARPEPTSGPSVSGLARGHVGRPGQLVDGASAHSQLITASAGASYLLAWSGTRFTRFSLAFLACSGLRRTVKHPNDSSVSAGQHRDPARLHAPGDREDDRPIRYHQPLGRAV